MAGSELDETGLQKLVDAFYARVRADPELGPIFEDAVDDWPAHLKTLTAFWSSVMLKTGRYTGRPVPAHMKHSGRMSPSHFERWLALWTATADDHMEPAVAAALKAKAALIGESLQLALFYRPDLDRGTPVHSRSEQRS